jgi:hypothetical protein
MHLPGKIFSISIGLSSNVIRLSVQYAIYVGIDGLICSSFFFHHVFSSASLSAYYSALSSHHLKIMTGTFPLSIPPQQLNSFRLMTIDGETISFNSLSSFILWIDLLSDIQTSTHSKTKLKSIPILIPSSRQHPLLIHEPLGSTFIRMSSYEILSFIDSFPNSPIYLSLNTAIESFLHFQSRVSSGLF